MKLNRKVPYSIFINKLVLIQLRDVNKTYKGYFVKSKYHENKFRILNSNDIHISRRIFDKNEILYIRIISFDDNDNEIMGEIISYREIDWKD